MPSQAALPAKAEYTCLSTLWSCAVVSDLPSSNLKPSISAYWSSCSREILGHPICWVSRAQDLGEFNEPSELLLLKPQKSNV